MNASKFNDTLDNFTLLEVYSTRGITLSQVPENETDSEIHPKKKEEISFDDTYFLEDNVEFPVPSKLTQNPQVDNILKQEAELGASDLILEIKTEDEEDMFADTSCDQLEEKFEVSVNKTQAEDNSPEDTKDGLQPLLAYEITIEEHALPDVEELIPSYPLSLSSTSPLGCSQIEAIGAEPYLVQMYDPVKKCLVTEKNPRWGNFKRTQSPSLLPASSTPTSSKIINKPPSCTVKTKLSEWGLPAQILERYHSRQLVNMFDWQAECLSMPGVCSGSSHLIYSAPTSAGKTLVAEILAIKSIIDRGKKAIFILPFVSIVREKMFYFRDIFDNTDVRIEGYMGSYNPPGGFQSVKLAICTIEKANNLINKLLQEGSLSEIGAVIVDEMHLLGDPNRGYILELLLAKLMYVSLKEENVNVQIIGMSATVPNIENLASWLNAELYVTEFRPIPLHEQVQCDRIIYNNKFEISRELVRRSELRADVDYILHLCLETICEQSCSVLIFCPTKSWCENLAQQIASAFFKLGKSGDKTAQAIRAQLNSDSIRECLEQLKYCPVGLDECLGRTVAFGVAFHHAGLTMDERDIIEAAFKNGVVRVLVATSTLSSGVNLPARRVIIRTPIFHGKLIDTLVYRQMIGRAGRMGKDTEGESILICQKTNLETTRSLINSNLAPIKSCLATDGKLKRALLEIIASGIASTQEDIRLFTSCTLMAQDQAHDDLITETQHFLISNEFVRFQDSRNIATSLGKACLASSLPPEEGLSLLTELDKARSCLALSTELHLIYLVTPYSACYQWGLIDWILYMNLWETLPSTMKKVGELVGVRESFIVLHSQGNVQPNIEANRHRFLVHKRFFVALVLQDLVNEIPLPKVCAKFNVNRGLLQSLQQTASTFAGMVTAFSKQLGWSSIELLVSQFQDRLLFGVSRDLLDLMRVPILNAKCARALYGGGIETLVQLANSSVDSIEDILHKVVPFESDRARDGESEFACKERNKFRNVWITGKEGLTEREAAELLLSHARDYLKNDMRLKEVQWNTTTPAVADNKSSVNASSNSLFSNNSNAEGTCSILEQSLLGNKSRNSLNSLNSSGDFIIKSSQDENSLVALDTKKQPVSSAKKRPRYEDSVSLASPMKKGTIATKSVVHRCLGLKNCLIQDATVEDIRRIFVAQRSFALSCDIKERQIEGFAFSCGTVVHYLRYQQDNGIDDLIRQLVDDKQCTIRLHNAKENIRILNDCVNLDWRANIEDPAVADWLLHPDGNTEKTIEQLIISYYPLEGIDSTTFKSYHPKLRICLEAAATWHLIDTIKEEMRGQYPLVLSRAYDVEMACVKILANMEIVGFGVDKKVLNYQIELMKRQMQSIEKTAYNWAGRRFSFTSSRDVTNVLDMLKSRVASKMKPTAFTKKRVLEKLHHPLADMIVEWRKLNCIVQQTARPLLLAVENDGRVHGTCVLYTATGRISMREPNVQNVAKDFEIVDCQSKETVTVSCRAAFVAKDGCVLVSADYCQLELRILAHLSNDTFLRSILTKKRDVFKAIAATWNKIQEIQVTDVLRNQAKQLCYGIIYGMTAATLAEQLKIEETRATALMKSFQDTFPNVKQYIKNVIAQCNKSGFVGTISGRRRYLLSQAAPVQHPIPELLSTRAERQGVNTTIQGSAADLVKQAMVNLETKCSSLKYNPRLVLHLHDELIYEIPKEHLNNFAMIMKKSMENSMKLTIPFPVKVKQGKCWGHMTTMSFS